MYTGIWYDRRKNTIHLWDDKKGYQEFKYQPYCYVLNPGGPYKTIFGDSVVKRTFNTPWEMKDELVDVWKDITFEADVRPEMRTLVDLYYDQEIYSPTINMAFLDIEVDIDDPQFLASGGGFPTPSEALAPINAITMFTTIDSTYHVWILKQADHPDPTMEWFDDEHTRDIKNNIELKVFVTEEDLLQDFIWCFREQGIRLYGGWNSENFDVPYIFNRITRVLGPSMVSKLSEIDLIEFDNDKTKGGTYRIAGSAHLDYMELYKKFTPNEQDSYKLDTIAHLELGVNKVEYSGPLGALYRKDLRTFLIYNVVDVKLLVKLDRKLQYFDLARMLAYKGNVPYESIVYTTMPIDGAILTFLKKQGLVAPNCPEKQERVGIQGAYVADPTPGLHEYVVDFDFTSLYPSIMRTLNISIETIVKKYPSRQAALLEGLEPHQVVAANGMVYDTSRRGVLPSLLDVWFQERVEYKEKMKEAKRKAQEFPEGSPERIEQEKLADSYHQLQYTTKILLNSVYGACALPSFRFFQRDNAEAVTTTGKLAITYSREKTNEFMEQLGVDDKVLYCDTDSMFISMAGLLKKLKKDFNDMEECSSTILTSIIPAFSKYHKRILDQFAREELNVHGEHFFHLKQELIARRMFFIDVKKRYGMWVINEEGVPADKIEFKGLDIRRSSYPPYFKQCMFDVCKAILQGLSVEEVENIIREYQKNVRTVPLIEIATPTGIKGMKPLGSKGLPAHVKSAHFYNEAIKDYPHVYPIQPGNKIKWVYLKNHPKYPTMAFTEDTPQEFIDGLKPYVDYDTIIDMNIMNKLEAILRFCGYRFPEKIDEGFDGFFEL